MSDVHANPTLTARVPQAEIPSVYGRIARVYDLWATLTEGRARRAGLRAAEVQDGEAILEVAVGTGLLFQDLVRANPTGRTEGVDLTERMLARARTKVARLPGAHRLQVGDARRLAFADGSFDLVMNSYMFDLLPEEDFAPVIAELRRVLRPGGRLVLINMALAERPWQRIYEWLYRANPRLMGGCRGVDMAPHVRAAGFRDVQVERLSQLGFPSEVVRARR
jgi:ubiquinone/menaquinone biosynthesis C-methylase UbiE